MFESLKNKVNKENLDELGQNLLEVFNSWDGLLAKTKTTLSDKLLFVITWTDGLVNLVEKFDIVGALKKETVIESITLLYDNIIYSSLPIYLKPLSPIIKYVLIKVIVSQMIEFIVKKYNEGTWSKNDGQVQMQTFPL